MASTRYSSPREVADRLGLHLNTVHKLISSGDLPSVKIGRSRRIAEEDLDAFLDARSMASFDEVLWCECDDPSPILTEGAPPECAACRKAVAK